MGLVRLTNPVADVISLSQAKSHLRVDLDDDDEYISGLIDTATELAEQHIDRQLIEATYRLDLDCFPVCIQIPRSPLISITSITYVDVNGDVQTLSPSEYQISSSREPAIILPAFQKYWPITRAVLDAVKVTFKAGYGSDADSVPSMIKQAMKIALTHWYENRGDDENTEMELPAASLRLLSRLWPGRYT